MDIFRGDIFYIAPGDSDCLDLKAGRPAVVVSNNMCNRHSEQIEVVFLTTKDKKPMPTHVDIICRQKSTALCEQIHTVHIDRIGEFIKSCTSSEMQRIDEALMVSLGIESNSLQYNDAEESAPEVKAERDLYKKLYEQLIDKITR